MYQEFHRALHNWYVKNGRHDLPWRNTRDAYAIYISETMLQQTQVKTVLERFYFPFLARFPTLQALADAPRADVLKAWEGLGYYNRAANLHEAAKRTAPHLPPTVEALEALPGIGRNTAHAVAAFAFATPVPVMEANVKRVLCRIFAMLHPKPEQLWEKAFALLDTEHPFDYNQAMMDIGATVCTKRAPKCGECPANVICLGKAAPELYPMPVVKKAIPVRKAKIIVWQDGRGRLHLAPRDGAFLRGLHGFAEYPECAETVSIQNKAYEVKKQGVLLGQAVQVYSHFRMEAEVWRMEMDEEGADQNWFFPEETARLALSGIDHKIWQLFKNAHIQPLLV